MDGKRTGSHLRSECEERPSKSYKSEEDARIGDGPDEERRQPLGVLNPNVPRSNNVQEQPEAARSTSETSGKPRNEAKCSPHNSIHPEDYESILACEETVESSQPLLPAGSQITLEEAEQNLSATGFCESFIPLRDEPLDISEYLAEREVEQMVEEDFMMGQTELTHDDREVLVDWVVDVCCEFRCVNETFFLCIGIIDHFLSIRKNTKRNEFQLLAVVAVSLALKFEQGRSPTIQELNSICDNAYTPNIIRTMEVMVLGTIQFRINRIHPLDFLRAFSKEANISRVGYNLSRYLCELSTLSVENRLLRPSLIAAAAIYASQRMLGVEGPWPQRMVDSTGYSREDMYTAGMQLYESFMSQQREPIDNEEVMRDALYRKYSSPTLDSVSRLIPHHL